MATVELPAGVIEYRDTGGDGPVIVLVHGVAMDGSVWRHVVRELEPDHRCIAPTLPLGSHRQPVRDGVDLSLRGIGALQVAFLDALDLRDVTLVGNDSGAFLYAATARPQRVARLVITACEAFDNVPPGLPGSVLAAAARMPGGVNALVQPLRVSALRRLPVAYGWMARRPIPAEITDGWLHPLLTQRRVRRDLTTYLRRTGRGDLVAATERLRSFGRPTLVVWGRQDRVMPTAHAQRLVDMLPDARLVWLDDCATLVPEDQPVALAAHIRDITADGT